MGERRRDYRLYWVSALVFLIVFTPKALELLKKTGAQPGSRGKSTRVFQEESRPARRPSREAEKPVPPYSSPGREARDAPPGIAWPQMERERLLRLRRGSFSPEVPYERTYLFVDGEARGISPFPTIELHEGPHLVHISNFELNASLDDEIFIVAGDNLAKAYSFPQTGAIQVAAIPWAEIFIGGRSYGVTPLDRIELPVGYYEVVFRHPSFPEKRINVPVKGGQIQKIEPMDMRDGR